MMRAAAVVAAVGFLVIASFQVVLALGAPLGRPGVGWRPRPTPLTAPGRERDRDRRVARGCLDRPRPRRLRRPVSPGGRPPMGDPGRRRSAGPRNGDEYRIPEPLGALPVGTARADPGGAHARRGTRLRRDARMLLRDQRHTVTTILPLAWPRSSSRIASAASTSGNVLPTTGVTVPASISSARAPRSGWFSVETTGRSF